MYTDEELAGRLQRGDPEALDALIRRHYQLVFAYIYRCTGGDYHTAYDLTQETFIKLVRAAGTLASGDSLKPWLLRIALNTCRDYYRSRTYKSRQSAPYQEELATTTDRVVHLGKDLEDREELERLLSLLPDYQRETMILRYYHDLKIKEIAEVMSVGESTVKSRLKQGLDKLRQRFGRREKHDKKNAE
ncbi:RNA polymerase sigma factor [Paenibacillus daejeonensis]|uniref:RNA polymerase sigma factor n=1 Tax=Paenibacillus daejeonensis TaxID=135193 RepID=UPI00035F1009|nr:RNA polymerase sigma factor [Paenibacillus daejeonensis]